VATRRNLIKILGVFADLAQVSRFSGKRVAAKSWVRGKKWPVLQEN